MGGEDSSPAGDLRCKSSAEGIGGEAADWTCPPASGLGSSTKTDSSTGGKDLEETATSDSGSTRADWDGLSTVDLELRVRGILKRKPLTSPVLYNYKIVCVGVSLL